MGVKSWHREVIGKNAVDALAKNDFEAIYVSTKEEAADIIMQYVSSESRVGFGGSMTVYALGIQDKVRAIGGKVLNHGTAQSMEEMLTIAKEEMLSDLFLCSSNAITLNGELVNIDAMGNRVAAMAFGPKKVIVVASSDKVCKDESAAFERLKSMEAPMNNKRLGKTNPCTKTGVCVDCKSPTRLCRVYSVIRRKPIATDVTVIIVGESIDF
jgi:methylmalonyl-CoA mutase cobalamin-binding subunit